MESPISKTCRPIASCRSRQSGDPLLAVPVVVPVRRKLTYGLHTTKPMREPTTRRWSYSRIWSSGRCFNSPEISTEPNVTETLKDQAEHAIGQVVEGACPLCKDP